MVHASRKFYELYVTGKSQINEQAFLKVIRLSAF